MAILESRHERLAALERLLAGRPAGWRVRDLAAELSVDPDTIRRDFDLLESLGTGVIKEGWLYRLAHLRRRHTVRLTTDQVLALYLAARLLARHSDEYNPHVAGGLDALAEAVMDHAPLLAEHITIASHALRCRLERPDYVAALETVTRGWLERRKLRVSYKAPNAPRPTDRIFAPYFLEPSAIGYACYAIGFDDARGKLLTLKIERMASVSLTDEAFTVPADFRPERLLASAWGVMWADDSEQVVSLRFAPAVVNRVKESIWHASQRIEDQADGSCLFSVRVGHPLEMKPWIRQWGADVEVLAPTALRAELAAEARAMARLYGPDDV